jgi:hypothetical protein
VMVYQCADPAQCPGGTVQGFSNSHAIAPGFYGATPSELAALDPLGIGPSLLASEYFNGLPEPNDAGLDGYNIMAHKFTAPFTNTFNTTIGRVDYRPAGNQSFFGRFNAQRDTVADVPQYPGLPPNTTQEIKNWGTAVGWDSVLSSTVVNTFRYGYTKMVLDTLGTLNGPLVYFRFADDLNEGFSSTGRRTPTHNFVNDTTWLKGSHTLKFGTNLRFTRIPSYTNTNSYSYATVNPSWVNGVGRTYTPGRDSCTLAGCSAIPAVDEGWNWADAWITMLGVVAQGQGQYNYDRDGNLLPVGEPARRNYAFNEYEFYAQDSWRLGDKLTINGGLRYSVASPPWETNGLQVAPNMSLGERFKQRQEMMARGIPENTLPDVQFLLSGPENGGKDLYERDKNNFAPRVSAAWTPTNKLVLRGGYSLVYDRIGPALAHYFDTAGSYGLSTSLSSPFGATNEDDPSVRFQGINTLPPSVPAAPPGGFPQTPPYDSNIYNTFDDTIVTPYAHTFNAVATFELTKNFTVEAAYVGRQGRNLLVERDMFMSLDLVDPQSGTDYYTASTEIIKQLEANGMDYTAVTPIAYYENLFPDAVNAAQVWEDPTFAGLTATQVMAYEYASWYPDHQSAMFDFDLFCFPACTRFGPYSYLNRQFAALSAQSTLARSEYNALQLTLRKRYSQGYQFDLNYTYGVSKDHGSQLERNNIFAEPVLDFGQGGYSSFLINSWDPDQQFSYSDFDIRHQLNFNWVAEFPWGRGKKWGSDISPWLDAVVGGWSMAGLTRWSSGLPFNVINARSAWATNWNLQGNASLKNPGQLPPTGTTKNVLNGKPSPFTVSPERALEFFRFDYPGEGGIRNLLRGDGYFSVDFSLAKSWRMPYSDDHRIWFRWDTFNVTNTPRFDVADVTMFPDRTSTFGTYDGTYASCDGNAGRCMQFSVRYEF